MKKVIVNIWTHEPTDKNFFIDSTSSRKCDKNCTVALVSFRIVRPDSGFDYLSSLQVVPSKDHLDDIAKSCQLALKGIPSDKNIKDKVLKELTNHGLKRGLGKFEIPANFTLISSGYLVGQVNN